MQVQNNEVYFDINAVHASVGSLPAVRTFRHLPEFGVTKQDDTTFRTELGLSYAEAQDRYLGSTLDLEFLLMGQRNGKQCAELPMGRPWDLDWEGPGASWKSPSNRQQVPWALTPVYSGLLAAGADKAYSNALQALSAELGERSRIAPDQRVRGNIATLTSGGFNPERFLFRLAVYYYLTHLAEKTTKSYTFTPRTQVTEFNNYDTWRSSLARAAKGANFIWLDVAATREEDLELVLAAQLVCAHPNTVADPLSAGVLRMLPSLGNVEILVRGGQPAIPSETSIRHIAILGLISHVIELWGVAKEMTLALEQAAVFIYRPTERGLFSSPSRGCVAGVKEPQFFMAALNSSALVLGPLGAHVPESLDDERTGKLFQPPIPEVMLLQGAVQYGAWEAALGVCLARTGLGTVAALGLHPSPNVTRALYTLLRNSGRGGGFSGAAFDLASQALSLKLPLVLQSVSLTSLRTPTALNAMLGLQGTVQWEELIPFTNTLPEECGFFGIQRAPVPSDHLPSSIWVSPHLITNSKTMSAGLYWAAQFSNVKMGVRITNFKEGSARVVPITPRLNYRGRVKDGQFCLQQVLDNVKLQTVIKVDSGKDAYHVQNYHKYWNSTTWDIEWTSLYQLEAPEEEPMTMVGPGTLPEVDLTRARVAKDTAAARALNTASEDHLGPLRDILGDVTGTVWDRLSQAMLQQNPTDRDRALMQMCGEVDDHEPLLSMLMLVEAERREEALNAMSLLISRAADRLSTVGQAARFRGTANWLAETARGLHGLPALSLDEAADMLTSSADQERIKAAFAEHEWWELVHHLGRLNMSTLDAARGMAILDHPQPMSEDEVVKDLELLVEETQGPETNEPPAEDFVPASLPATSELTGTGNTALESAPSATQAGVATPADDQEPPVWRLHHSSGQ